MAERQYIGARYVPVFADPVEWDNVRQYEALTIVTHLGNSFTSRKPVPAGVDIANGEYWVNTGNYNAQVANYQQQVVNLSTEVAGITAVLNTLYQDGVSLKNPPNNLTPCDPTGATDSTNAFNAILAYARTNNKAIIVDGVYQLSANVVLKTGDRFIGLGTNTSNYDTTPITDLSGVISGFAFNGGGFRAIGRQASIILFNFAIINIGTKESTIGIKGERLRGSYIVNTQTVNFMTGLDLGVDTPEFMNDNAMFNRVIGYGAVRCNTCIHLYGGSNGDFSGNACHNLFMDIGVNTDAVGILLDDSDNNTFIKCYCFQRGGDWAYQFNRNARSNYFYHLQGRVLINNGKNNWIYGYDRENGQALPYCPAGSLNIITSDGVLLMQRDGVNRYFQSGTDYNYTGIAPSSGSLAVNTNTSAGQPLFYVVGSDGNWKGQVTIT